MKSIGIKLADGSFYPLIQEGNPERKSLDLTTVMDNQTKVQVEVYRTETGTLEGAEYLDTLEIKNLKPHQNGEPTLLLDINIDENNELSAEIRDPETGKKSDIQITLISKTLIKENGLSPENTDGEETKLAPKQDEEFAFDDVNESLTQNQEEETEAAETSTEEIELPSDLPDFDDEFSDDSDTLTDSDVSEINMNEESDAAEEEKEDEELEDFNSPILNFNSEFEEEKNDPFADDSTTLDMDTLNSIAADATESDSSEFPLPDFDDLDSDSNDLDSPFAAEESVEDPFAETTSEDFSLPDFGDDLEETGSSDIENSNDFNYSFPNLDDDEDDPFAENEEPVKDPTFQPSTNMFSNLYDDDSYPEKESNKKTIIPMIICILCAIICVAAVILFVFKGFSFKKTEKKSETKKEEIVSIVENAEDPVEEEVEVVEEEPQEEVAAVEDTIVVAETPAQVVPEKPAPSKEKIPDVRYKIKWGDTLWDICKAYYKNPWRYKFLARYNGIKNPDKIISGNVIYIPAE